MESINSLFVESNDLVSGFVPINLATGANTGDFVSLKGYASAVVVFFAAAGTAGDDPTLTLQQATDVANSASDVKNLTFTRIDTKQGTLTAVGTYTTVTQAAAATYTDATSAEVQKIWIVEVRAEDLDVANGFDCIRASVADVGTNSQIGCLFYILRSPRLGVISSIVD